jgi:hypothetical protein
MFGLRTSGVDISLLGPDTYEIQKKYIALGYIQSENGKISIKKT